MNKLNLILFLSIFGLASCQHSDAPFRDNLEDFPVLKKVLADSNLYQVQIIYTQIDRNEHGNPLMTSYTYNLDESRYFYPASTVKLPVAILALEWLEEQGMDDLSAESIMLTDSVHPSQILAWSDSTSKNNFPSIAHYVKKILLVSDNDAYNRLYELLGQEYINEKLKEKGLLHTVINHRLSFPASPEENRMFNPVYFQDSLGNSILEIPARTTDKIYFNSAQPKIGNGYYLGDSLVKEPLDFTHKNRFSLTDFDGVVKRMIFPEAFLGVERFNLNEEHRSLVLKYMSMLPGESDFPSYPQSEYWDTYSKFYKDGLSKDPIPASIRIFNKTGQAYGHLLDGSYFVDFEHGIEFFVTAIIYVNSDQILNDDQYEYDAVGFPFFAELGQYLHQRELKRKKQIPADLGRFKFEY